MCDALRGMLTGFVLRLRGGSFRALERLRFIPGSGSFWPIAAFREEHPRVDFSRSQHAEMGYQRHHRVDLLAC